MLEGRGDEQGGKMIRRYEGGKKNVEGRKRWKEKAVVWDKVVKEGTAEVKEKETVMLQRRLIIIVCFFKSSV